MIIRSQDKKSIKPIESCNEIYVLDSIVFIDGRKFGEYSTEEKAIKVLDMICEKYNEPIVRANYTNEESLIYANSVFWMPSDEEVEV